jgi:hypothetical protein
VLWQAGYDAQQNQTGMNGASLQEALPHVITPWRAGLVFGAWALLFTAVAYLLIERRDA